MVKNQARDYHEIELLENTAEKTFSHWFTPDF